MTIENIFIEFMSLYYKNTGTKPGFLKDIPIESGIIARYTELGCNIYYLTTGNYIKIPWEIMDLFLSLNVYSGHRILSLFPENKIERIIQLFVKFVDLLNNISNRNESITQVLSDIFDIGVGTFRKWYKDKFNKTLDPVEFFGPDKNFEI